MTYLSTRQPIDDRTTRSFDAVLRAGLAPDGGLYVPSSVPRLDHQTVRHFGTLDYPTLAARILGLFIGDALQPTAIEAIARAAYRPFTHTAIAPLKQLGRDEWVLELFHGPTLAFKDYALQVLSHLFQQSLDRTGDRVTIVGATSGDTGSAAMHAFAHRGNVDIFILYPHGRPSEVQRRQMTTLDAPNVHAIAVDGSFDDCQDLVKALFADEAFRATQNLSAVNSINWARIAAQIVYYFAAATALGSPERPVRFIVPTGNFGNVYAGHMARLMGLPIAGLTVATNRNDILYRFLTTGRMALSTVEPSLSPSMDIQVSSNFERLLFELLDRDGDTLARTMTEFRSTGLLPVAESVWHGAQAGFDAFRLDDAGIKDTIARVWRQTGELLDPHSAVSVAAMQAMGGEAGIPRVALACAHPAKFPEIMREITGRTAALPPSMAHLMDLPERLTLMPKDYMAIRTFIAANSRNTGGAQ